MKNNSKTVNIILAVVLAIIVIGGALYYFLVVNKSNNSSEPEANTTANATVDNANATVANTQTQPQVQQQEPPKPEYETILSEVYKDNGNRFEARYPGSYSFVEDDAVRVQFKGTDGTSIYFMCDINSEKKNPEDFLKEYMDSPIMTTSDVSINGDSISFIASRANGQSSFNYYIVRNDMVYGYRLSYDANQDYTALLNAMKQCAQDGKLIVVK